MAEEDERIKKVRHNEEMYKKMATVGRGINGENHIEHHVDRCNRG